MVSKPDDIDIIDFAYSFRPIYYFSRVGGMIPFSIFHNSQSATIRKRDITWLAISIFSYLSVLILIVYDLNVPNDENSNFNALILGDILHAILCTVFGIVAIIMDMGNRFKFMRIFKKFTTFDEQVSYWYFRHSKHWFTS